MCLYVSTGLQSSAHFTKIGFFSIFAVIMKNRKNILLIIAVFIALLVSCSKESIHGDGFICVKGQDKNNEHRGSTTEKRNVLILYSAGYNSLSDYLIEDISDLKQGWLPGSDRNDNVLLVYSHFPTKRGIYSTPTSPTLTRIYKNLEGKTISDTLAYFPSETYSATAEQLHTVLTYVKTEFQAKSYGMIFSSHATGYLPSGYYAKPNDYIYQDKNNISYRYGMGRRYSNPVPYIAPKHDPSLPDVKSIGQDQVGTFGNYVSYEIELDDFAKALPMQMEYILFDACLMGGVEVAYELKDKCHYVGFSQTEVLAEGFDYRSLAKHLLGSDTPNPQAVCEDFFHQYYIQSGTSQSATISMVDCTEMNSLSAICCELFHKYREAINRLQASKVQRYYRYDYCWFFDLYDIIAKAGATEEELSELQKALDICITYKSATPGFMGSFTIDTYSGLSMYLPSQGSIELDKYYRTLQWNKDTALVE